MLADIADNVAGNHLEVESITKVGAEIHGYEPTPGDIRKASKADLVLDNGLNLEQWFSQFVDDIDVPHAVVSEGVEELSITADADAGKPNPHAWMSPLDARSTPRTWLAPSPTSTRTMPMTTPPMPRTTEHSCRRSTTTSSTNSTTLPKSQRALVTCEGAFSYLTRDTGLSEKYIWPVNAEAQATPGQITSAIDFVKDNDVPAVFCESTVSSAPMDRVVESTDAEFGGTLYVDSLSESDGPVPTYLDLIRHDAQVISEALTGGRG